MNDDLSKMIENMMQRMKAQMDDAMVYGDTKPPYRIVGHGANGKVTPILDIPSALRGDDRPAPNADEWETQMLRLLGGEASE